MLLSRRRRVYGSRATPRSAYSARSAWRSVDVAANEHVALARAFGTTRIRDRCAHRVHAAGASSRIAVDLADAGYPVVGSCKLGSCGGDPLARASDRAV